MALKPLNSVGGFSVGEIPDTIIDGSGNITAYFATLEGNLLISNATASWGIKTDNLYYSNGVPWDLQEAAGANNQIQFNTNNNFAASANLTFDPSTNFFTVLGNAQFNNANLGNLATANYVNVASALNIAGGGTANLGNLIVANFANIASNTVTNNLTVNLELAGNTANFTGNISAGNANLGNLATANFVNVSTNVNVTGTMQAGNVRTDNLLYANGVPWDLQEAAGSNNEIQFNTNDNFDASANFTFNPSTNVLTVNGNANVTNTLLTPNVNSGTGNLTLTSNGFSTVYDNTGNVTFSANAVVTAKTFVGNVSGNLTISAPNTTVIFSDAGAAVGSNAFTFDKITNAVVITGNLQSQNANLGNLVTANFANIASNAVIDNVYANFASVTGNIVVNNVNVNLTLAGNTANFTGNITAANANLGNLVTANFANFTNDLVVQGNIANANNISITNNLNAVTGNFSGNINSLNANLGNLALANFVNVASNITTSNLTVNLELQANTANFDGAVIIDGNLNVANLNTYNIANGNSNIRIFQDANLEFSSAGSANVVTITGTELLAVGNIRSTSGNVQANGNVTANSFLVGANLAVTGEANVGSLLTSNITSNGNLTITATGTDKNINFVPGGPNGTVDMSLARVVQVGDPTQPHDAATKEYVDSTSQGLTVHTAVRVTSITNLTATYANGGSVLTTIAITGGKTIQFSAAHGLTVGDEIAWDNAFNGIIDDQPYFVYSTPAADTITVKNGYYGAEVTTLTNGTGLSQTARANTGVGATLTNAGANAAISIDGISLASTNRVLVQGQTNQFENGIYTVTTVGNGSTAWVLTRATTEDTYSPKETTGLGYGDYFFVQEGLNNAGSSYTVSSPVGEILFGLTNIAFSQFSAAGSYTAGNGIAITGTTISANVDNDTTAISSGNIVVKAGANLTTPNLGDATFSSLSWNNLSNGNVTANNLSIGNIANITLDLTVGGNIQANGTISSNANVSGLNLTTSGNVHAQTNVLAANITANSTVFAANANVSGTTITNVLTVNTAFSGNTANFSGNLLVNNLTVNLELAGNTANFSGNVVANNFSTSGSGGNITGANVVSANTFSGNLEATYANATGNITGGNLVTAGVANVAQLNVTGNVTSDLLPNANLTHDLGNATLRWDNVYAGNVDVSGNVTTTGNLSANNFSANTFTANTAVDIGNSAIYSGTVTTTSITANQTVSSVAVSGVTGVEWIVKGADSAGAKYTIAIITAVTDGANAEYSTFGSVQLGGSTGTLAVNIVGSNMALQVTPASSNSTVWTTQYRTI